MRWRTGALLAAALLAFGGAAPAWAQADAANDDLFGDVADDDLFGDPGDGLDDEPRAAAATATTEASDSDVSDTTADAAGAPGADTEALDPLQMDGSGPTEGIEELLIQGQQTGPLVTDTDTSTTVFTPEDLTAMGVEDVSDIARHTPNLEIRQADTTTATFFIRGVGLADFSSNAAGAVAIYVDDVPMNSPPLQLGQIFDVQGLEVVKGPQGTGQGRNASAGIIRISSRRPTLENSATLTLSNGSILSDDARDAFRLDYQGAVETVLVPDTVGARFSFRARDFGPYIRNGCGNAPPLPRTGSFCGEATGVFRPDLRAGLDDMLGQETAWAARAVFRILPPDSDVDVLFVARGSRLEQDSTVGQAMGARRFFPFVGANSPTATNYREPDGRREYLHHYDRLRANGVDNATAIVRAQEIVTKNVVQDRVFDLEPYRGDYSRTGTTTLDTWGGSLDVSWEGEYMRFQSVTAVDSFSRYRDADQDMTPDVLFEAQNNRDEAIQFAQVLTLDGELREYPGRWGVGGTFLTEKLEADLLLRTDSSNFINGRLARSFEQDLYSFQVYAEFEYDIWEDDLTLHTGVRYNWERKNFQIDEVNTFTSIGSSSDDVWDEPTGTVKLTYHYDDDIDIYWTYAHGFKAGHFNTNKVDQKQNPNPPADPETIDSFEIGINGSFLDGILNVQSAWFHYDYDQYQVFNFESEPGRNPSLEIINANSAEVYGAEAEARITPLVGWVPPEVEQFEVVLRGAWLQSEFLDFTDQQTDIGTGGGSTSIVADFTGNQLINSPEWSFSGNVRWEVDLGAYGALIPRWDFSWTDDVFYDATQGRGQLDVNGNTSKPPFTVGQPAYWLHDVRMTYRTGAGNLELAGWCRNVMDTRYKTYGFDASRFGGVVINFVGEPRTCGADLKFTW